MRHAAHEAGVQMRARPSSCRKVVLGSAFEITRPRRDAPRRTRAPRRRRGRRCTRMLRTGALGADRRAGRARRPWPAHRDSAPMPPPGCASPAPRAAPPPAGTAASTPCPASAARSCVPSTASKASAPLSSGDCEMLLEQVVDVHAADAQQLAHVAPPEPADLPAEAQQRQRGRAQASVPRRGGDRARAAARSAAREAPHARRSTRRTRRASAPRRSRVPPPSGSGAPSGTSAVVGSRCAAQSSPCDLEAADRAAASAGIRCSRCAHAETRNPGANSRVTRRAARPAAAASSTSTERPPRASVGRADQAIVAARR